MPQAEPTIKVNVDFDELNEAIEKANKLVELLRKVFLLGITAGVNLAKNLTLVNE